MYQHSRETLFFNKRTYIVNKTVQLHEYGCSSCSQPKLGWPIQLKASDFLKNSYKNVCFRKCYLLHSILNRFWTKEVSCEIHNTSKHRIQGWSISLVTRLSGSGMRADVKLFQKWKVNESFRIFLNKASCWALSASVAGAVKYLFAAQVG